MADPIADRDAVEALLVAARKVDAKAETGIALGTLRNETIRAAEAAERSDAATDLETKLAAFEASELGQTPKGQAAAAELRAIIAKARA